MTLQAREREEVQTVELAYDDLMVMAEGQAITIEELEAELAIWRDVKKQWQDHAEGLRDELADLHAAVHHLVRTSRVDYSKGAVKADAEAFLGLQVLVRSQGGKR